MRHTITTRRGFLRNGALALWGSSALPAFLTRSLLAEAQARAPRGRLVVVFQRGAVDGLNMVVPVAEPNYYRMRPSISIPQKDALLLDDRFGLHPTMGAMAELYQQGHLAVVHAVGSTDTTRSHFDAQDYMESGTPGVKATADGWLNRAMAADALHGTPSPYRAVALDAQMPRTLAGRFPALALGGLGDVRLGDSGSAPTLAAAWETMYDEGSNTLLRGAGAQTFAALRMLKAASPAQYQPRPGVSYPRSVFADRMRQIAQLLKADLGLEAAFTDVGGWDTHVNQGASDGQLAHRLRDFSDTLGAFWQDLGAEGETVTVVTMSEFGRTARQNGTGGTDHGHANAMFVLGGHVRGGKVFGRWPGLEDDQLNERRDLAVTTDFREVLWQSAHHALGVSDHTRVFPGLSLPPAEPMFFSPPVAAFSSTPAETLAVFRPRAERALW